MLQRHSWRTKRWKGFTVANYPRLLKFTFKKKCWFMRTRFCLDFMTFFCVKLYLSEFYISWNPPLYSRAFNWFFFFFENEGFWLFLDVLLDDPHLGSQRGRCLFLWMLFLCTGCPEMLSCPDRFTLTGIMSAHSVFCMHPLLNPYFAFCFSSAGF